jgi:predicted phage tail protein
MGATMGGTGATEPRNTVGQGASRRAGAATALASGPLLFAALMLIAGGAFQVLEGTAALIRGSYFTVASSYPYRANVTAWGWIHVILGIVLIAVSVWVLGGSVAARFTAMALAVVSAVVHFLYIPYQPIWAVLIIVVDVAVIWALAGFETERI